MKKKLLIVAILDFLIITLQVNCYLMKNTGEYLSFEYSTRAVIPTIIILVVSFALIMLAKKEENNFKMILLTINIIFAVFTLIPLGRMINSGYDGQTLCSLAAGCKDNEDGKTVTCHLVKEDKTLSKRTFICYK